MISIHPNRLFFTKNIKNQVAQLDEEESRHLISVLRQKIGDEVFVTDGLGNFFRGTIASSDKKSAFVQILETIPQIKDPALELHIAIPPMKMLDRWEWFLEKATEIGVDRITPILCRRSEREKLRMDRSEKIVISAMKQSAQAHLPILDEPMSFEKLAKSIPSDVLRLIPHCEDGEKKEIQDLLPAQGKVCIFIGPAGDFHPDELALAFDLGFLPVSLGQSRLRSETAGIAVACAAKFHIKKSP